MNYNVIIIGGGAAGISAALWCDDLGLSALLLEQKPELGGQLLRVYNRIENHLGTTAENGKHLRDIFVRQIENRKFNLITNAKISEINLKNKTVFLDSGEKFTAEAVIIATGVSRRKLGIEGETEFQNRGILTSGERDKDSVKNKTVAVIGGGDAALENALILAETADKVTLIHRSKEFRARREFLEKARENTKINFLTDTKVIKFTGEKKLTLIETKNLQSGEISKIPLDAVLIRIGVEPNTKIFSEQLILDKKGYIKINDECKTNVKHIWATGDAANPISPTISSAVGMGAMAVKSIYNNLILEIIK